VRKAVAKLLIWGASGHARVVAEAVVACGSEEIAAFVDETTGTDDRRVFALPVLRDRKAVLDLKTRGVDRVVIGFGDCAERMNVAKWCVDNGLTLVSVIHPSAILSPSCSVKPGSVILAGVVVGAGAQIGENVILNTAATVDHDCIVGDGSHLSPGVHLGGNVTIGKGSWIGIGASVRNGVTIGDGTVVGAGAVVVKSLPNRVVAYGVPARIVES